MEIDKKIIKKLIEVLEDLKKSLKDNNVINNDDPIKDEIEIHKTVIKKSYSWNSISSSRTRS